jgi:drug/metabolite transporter (DMT)-like permease
LALGQVHPNAAAGSFVAVAALGMLGTGIAYVLNFEVIRQAPPTIASSVTYVVPIFAVVVGAAFLGETVHWYEPAGAALILLGAAITQDRMRRRRRRRPSSAPVHGTASGEMRKAG